MIVECHSCGATYNISDEKIRGRRVRVRCKSCSEGIIVDGTRVESDEATRVYSPTFEPTAYAAGVHDEATRVLAPSAPDLQATAAGDEWTVNVSESDQRTMHLTELVSAYTGGLIPDDALVWREGMDDWLPIRDVPEVKTAIESTEATHVVSPAIAVRAPRRASGDRAAVHVDPVPPPRARQPSLMDARPPSPVELVPAPAPRAPARPPAATPAAPPAPARVREGRGRGADLFGNIEREGGEDALLGSTSLSQYEDKPIGARNESSVLFSLDALKAGARRGSSAPPRTPSSPPQQTAADILGMTAGGALPGMGSGGSVNALPGMGAVGPLFSAPAVDAPLPVFSPEPPPRSRMDTLPPTMRGRRSMTVPIAVVIAAIFVLGAAILVLHNRFSSTPKVTEEPTAEATADRPKAEPTTTVAKTAETAAPTNEPAAAQPTTEPTAQPVATAAAPVAPHEPRPSTHADRPAAKSGTEPSNVEAFKAAMRPDDGQGATKPPSEKVVLAEDTSGGDNTGADTPEPQKPPFDTSAAKAALEAASSSAASCKKDDGPTGRGKVQVTFSPAGRATSANVIEGPFGGTTVGGCVAKIFRGAKVPAFAGDAVTVSKSFTIPE